MVDFIPSILRSVFEIQMYKKYGHNWKENISTNDVKTSHADEKVKLESKDIETWDVSLVGKMLLYSGHFLLLDEKVYKVDELDSKLDDICWKEGDEVLILNGKNNMSRAKFDGVEPLSFVKVDCPDKKIDFEKYSKKATIHLCKPEWKAVNKLFDFRNSKFAHCPSAFIENNDFQKVVTDVMECCTDLDKSDDAAAEIDTILSGMLKYY